MLLFCDSFDHYVTLSQKWDSVTGVAAITGSLARTGKQSASAGASAGFQKNFSPRATYIVGFALKVTATPSQESYIHLLWDGSTIQCCVTVDATGVLRFRRGNAGGTLLGTASSVLGFGTWHYVEIKTTINGVTGVAEIHLDGLSVLALASQNTQSTASASAGGVAFGAPGLGGTYACNYDDLYICDNAGSHNNSYLGDVSVLMRLPSANGTVNNYTAVWAAFINSHVYALGETFKDSNGNVQQTTVAGTSQSTGTPTWATTGGSTTTSGGATFAVVGSGANPGAKNWMAVSENPPDDNSSYVTDATVSDQDRYTYPTIAGSQVFAAVVNLRAEKDDSATRTIRAVTDSGGTVADNGSDFALTLSSYADFQGIFETDPNTGVAWTVAGVNAAEFGVKTTA